MSQNAEQNKGVYMDLPWESYSELYFLYWVEELKKHGYIHSIERAKSYLLSEPTFNTYTEQLKTKTKEVTQLITHGHVFTPDYDVVWNYKMSREKFLWLFGSGKCNKPFIGQMIGDDHCRTVVEVKPKFDFSNMTRQAIVSVKWTYQVHGVLINIIKPLDLYEKTFVPRKYLTTKTGRARKLNYKPATLFDYLNNRTKHLMYDNRTSST